MRWLASHQAVNKSLQGHVDRAVLDAEPVLYQFQPVPDQRGCVGVHVVHAPKVIEKKGGDFEHVETVERAVHPSARKCNCNGTRPAEMGQCFC